VVTLPLGTVDTGIAKGFATTRSGGALVVLTPDAAPVLKSREGATNPGCWAMLVLVPTVPGVTDPEEVVLVPDPDAAPILKSREGAVASAGAAAAPTVSPIPIDPMPFRYS
jgi:hypothetical protein